MSEMEPSSADRRREPRVPVEARVDLVFDSFASFISDYVTNVSRGGMFIVSTQPRPAGTRLTFELRLTDDYPLVRGRGEVVWTRAAESSAGPAGMAVRFVNLDDSSRELIERMLAQHLRDGGEPFDLEPAAAAGDTTEVVPHGRASADPFEAPRAPAPPAAGQDVFAAPFAAPAAAEPWVPSEPWRPPQAADALPFAAEPRPGPDPPAPAAAPPHRAQEPAQPAEKPARRATVPPAMPPAPGPPPALVTPAAALEEQLAAFDEPPPPRQARRTGTRRWPALAVAALVVVTVAAFAAWYLRVGPSGLTGEPAAGSPDATPVVAPAPVVEEAAPVVEETAAGEVVEPAAAAGGGATGQVADPVAAPQVAAAGPASAVEEITWRMTGGATEVVIHGDGSLDPARVRSSRLVDPPRLLLRLSGIDQPFHDRPLTGTGPHLAGVRVGFHPEMDPNELHVVLDLRGDGVQVEAIDASPEGLMVRLTGS